VGKNYCRDVSIDSVSIFQESNDLLNCNHSCNCAEKVLVDVHYRGRWYQVQVVKNTDLENQHLIFTVVSHLIALHLKSLVDVEDPLFDCSMEVFLLSCLA